MPHSLTSDNPMKALYARLQAAGFSRSYVRKYALPEWWRDESGLNPAGFAMGRGYIARYLGLSLEALQNPNSLIQCQYPDQSGLPKFKMSPKVGKVEVQWAACMAARVAELALKGTPKAVRQLPKDGVSPREAILRSGAPLRADETLNYCRDTGVPVLHLSHFPSGKKMDGLAASFNGRPAIVIAKNHKNHAWLSFILAHELGHIARGHLADAPFVFDEKIRHDSTEHEEIEANEFAVEMLSGDKNRKYVSDLRLNASQLADAAIATGQAHKVDPGVIALNYAWHQGFMAVGQAALNLIEPEANAVDLIRRKLQERLCWDRLPEETAA